jgi:hypothetical protein
MGFIQLHAGHLQMVDHLLLLSPLKSDPLKAMYGLDVHPANIGRALVTHAPSLTFEQLLHRGVGQLTAGHQRAFALGKLVATARARQSFDMLVLTRPRPVTDIAPTGLVEITTGLIRTGKSAILIVDNWCRSHIWATFPARKSS